MVTFSHGPEQVLLHSTPLEVTLLHSNCPWQAVSCTTVTVEAAQLKEEVRLHSTPVLLGEVQLHSTPLEERLFRNSCP